MRKEMIRSSGGVAVVVERQRVRSAAGLADVVDDSARPGRREHERE